MLTIKEVALTAIAKMPENSTSEEIMYEINFIAQVLKGLNDSKEGKTITTEELLNRVKTWAK